MITDQELRAVLETQLVAHRAALQPDYHIPLWGVDLEDVGPEDRVIHFGQYLTVRVPAPRQNTAVCVALLDVHDWTRLGALLALFDHPLVSPSLLSR